MVAHSEFTLWTMDCNEPLGGCSLWQNIFWQLISPPFRSSCRHVKPERPNDIPAVSASNHPRSTFSTSGWVGEVQTGNQCVQEPLWDVWIGCPWLSRLCHREKVRSEWSGSSPNLPHKGLVKTFIGISCHNLLLYTYQGWLDLISQFTTDYGRDHTTPLPTLFLNSNLTLSSPDDTSPAVDFRTLALAQVDNPNLARLQTWSSLRFQAVPLAFSDGVSIVCDISTPV